MKTTPWMPLHGHHVKYSTTCVHMCTQVNIQCAYNCMVCVIAKRAKFNIRVLVFSRVARANLTFTFYKKRKCFYT